MLVLAMEFSRCAARHRRKKRPAVPGHARGTRNG
jgi:hypothetical protein